MVDCAVRWEVVKAMWLARFRGHGWVKRSLEALRVPRSSGYRWDKSAQWLFETGVARLRAQESELAAVREEAAQLRREAAAASCGMSRRQVERLVVYAAVLGTSDTGTAQLGVQAGGPQLSHTTVWEIVSRWSEAARVVFERYFQGVGETAAWDETYLGKKPLLLTCEPVSLLVNGLRLAEGRSGEDWRPVFRALRELKYCSGDGALGIRAAAKERGVEVNGDMFHLLGLARRELETLARRVEGAETRAAEAAQRLARAKFRDDERGVRAAAARTVRARKEAERLPVAYCRLDDLFQEVEKAFAYTRPDGRLQTAAEARATITRVLGEMEQLPEGQELAAKLAALKEPSAMRFHEVLENELSHLDPKVLGPDPAATLERLVAETLAWRRKDKSSIALLEAASNGSEADVVELAVLRAVDLALRSSSPVECINSRVRLVQVARKRLSENFVCLMAVHHNLRTLGRGSVRKGHTPAELAGIPLPTNDFFELLEMAASEFSASAVAA